MCKKMIIFNNHILKMRKIRQLFDRHTQRADAFHIHIYTFIMALSILVFLYINFNLIKKSFFVHVTQKNEKIKGHISFVIFFVDHN